MKVRDLKGYIFDKVVLYKSDTDDFVDVYKGHIDNDTPQIVLDLEVRNIGAKKKELLI